MEDLIVFVLMVTGFMLVIVSLFLPKIVGKKAMVDDSSASAAKQQEIRSLEKVEDHLIKLEDAAREAFGRIDTRSRLLIRLIEEAEVRRREINEVVDRLRGANS